MPERAGGPGRAATGLNLEVDWSPWYRSPAEAGLFTDFDGTLAPIGQERDQARPLPGAREALLVLARGLGRVAVVSGRPAAYLQLHLGDIPGLALVGLHGLEHIEEGHLQVLPEALAWASAVESSADAAEQEAPAGVEVERKSLAFTIHARRRPEAMGWVANWAQDRAANTGLRAQPGRLSVEVLPPVAADKGMVVERMSAGLSAVAVFGDDTGDIPAFALLSRLRRVGAHTLAVGVNSPEAPEDLAGSVDLVVGGPGEAVELLGQLAAFLA